MLQETAALLMRTKDDGSPPLVEEPWELGKSGESNLCLALAEGCGPIVVAWEGKEHLSEVWYGSSSGEGRRFTLPRPDPHGHADRAPRMVGWDDWRRNVSTSK